MHSGGLKHRIHLQRKTRSTDAFGQDIYTFSTYATVWAEIRAYRGKESEQAGMQIASRQVQIKVRYRPDITRDDRVLDLGTGITYSVNDVLDEYGHKKELFLYSTQVY